MKRWTFLLTAAALSCLATPTAHAAECAKACPAIYQPVCASNGKTYSNECAFNIEKCKINDASLTIAKTGECSTDGGSTGGGSAPNNGSGTPECIKEFACLDVEDPVCGSNGVTYTNACVLKKAQCTDKTIQKTADGACKKDATSSPPATAPVTTAPSSSGSGSGVDDVACSKICTKEIEYVCGSDGVSYANACLLEQQKACTAPTLTKASDGKCGGADADAGDATTAPSSQPPTTSSGRTVAASWATAASFAGCVFAAVAMA